MLYARNPLGGLLVRLPLPVAASTLPIIPRKVTGNYRQLFQVSNAQRLVQNRATEFVCSRASEWCANIWSDSLNQGAPGWPLYRRPHLRAIAPFEPNFFSFPASYEGKKKVAALEVAFKKLEGKMKFEIYKVEAQGDVLYIQAENQQEARKILFDKMMGPIPDNLLTWHKVRTIPTGEELLHR